MRLKLFPNLGRFLPTIMLSLFLTGYAMADASVVSPGDYLALVLKVIGELGGLSWMLKIAAVVTLVLSSMKVSFLNDMIWSKLGKFKAWAAPILGLLIGVITMQANGGITLVGLMAYLSAGAGALILHELLDTVKSIPGLGPIWVSLIEAIQKALGGPSPIVQVPSR